jgi:RHS repeat-associated protein
MRLGKLMAWWPRRAAHADFFERATDSEIATGWVISEQRTIAGKTNSMSYTYNGDGTVSSVTYPSSRTITYGETSAQRITSAKDLTNNIQYAVTASYAPVGALNTVIYGPATGFTGISTNASYNSRLEPTAISASSSAGTAQSLSFNYSLPTGNDGTLAGVQNVVTSGLSESFTYDSLNRILSAATTATSGAGCWGQSFGTSGAPPPGPPDDRWSNLTEINVTQCSAGSLSVTASSSTNQLSITGVSGPYDASGNMVKDGTYTYAFDAENHLLTASGMSGGPWSYVYDGHGLRVEKTNGSTGTLYWRDISGNTIAETDLTGSTTNAAYREYVFFAGQRIASRDSATPTPNVYYYYADQVGSTITITTANGTPCYQATFTPYGQEMATQTTCSSNYKFTGYERDAETGLDYAFARYYNSRLARFMSADPLGGDSGDPQSLNRYAYVGNGPTSSTDPTGMLRYPCRNRDGECDWGDDNCNVNGAADYCGDLYWGLLFDASFQVSYTFAAGPNFDWWDYSDSQLLAAGLGGEFTLVDISLSFVDGDDSGGGGSNGFSKSNLKNILKKHPECAKLLGGLSAANRLINAAQTSATNAPGWQMPTTFNDPMSGPAVAKVAEGTGYAAVDFGGGHAWNGSSFTIYTNGNYSSLGQASAQMTVIIHELQHVFLGHTAASTALDNNGYYPGSQMSFVTISKACGTAVPKPNN